MSRIAAAFAIALACFAGTPCLAQDEGQEAPQAEPVTAEEIIEVAREAYRVPGLRRGCPAGAQGEIVVCAPDQSQFRVPSTIDQAIEAGQAVDDGVPRAPDLYGGMVGGVTVARGCFIPPCPRPMPPMIDYDAIPTPLTPEEAALVFRAEDAPSPEGASPAAAP